MGNRMGSNPIPLNQGLLLPILHLFFILFYLGLFFLKHICVCGRDVFGRSTKTKMKKIKKMEKREDTARHFL